MKPKTWIIHRKFAVNNLCIYRTGTLSMVKYIYEHENWTDFTWHAALFPTGYSGLYPIETGIYRTGVMQIVSAAMGKEKRYYKAIKPEFWNLHESTPINKGQRLMINKLFDGFDGKL